ncbi:hypothetical protein OG423_14090 [Micromonospora zamorensis]|uniref:hypothetical protein n=1 Tax=Micromonospora zamorensis TaxID=709883 RepID=UPI00352B456F|nr:hypothetical protein OG423_14090 [Micromonospora zamorensis]
MPVPAGSTPPAPPSSGPLYYDPVLSRVRLAAPVKVVVDAFGRTVFPGWGPADSGHVWTTAGGDPNDYGVNGTKGYIGVTSVNVWHDSRLAVGFADMRIVASHVQTTVTPTGAQAEVSLRIRDTGTDYIECRLFPSTSNTVTINLVQMRGGVETLTGFPTVPGVNANSPLSVEVDAQGPVLRARAWLEGSVPPVGWQVQLTATHLAAGDFAFRCKLAAGNSNTLPLFVELDGLTITPSVTVERSTDQIVWSTVRGGAALTPVADEVRLDDYEFTPDVTNYYRVGALFTGSIVPDLGGVVWLKSLARPYLNQQVTVRDYSEVTRRARAGVFEVVGRSVPVAVTDVRGSRQWSLDVNTYSARERSDLDMLLASGDILLVHVPASGRVSATPGGYVTVGDTREVTPPTSDLAMRVFSLPCVEVAAPGPDVLGATITCQGVLDMYATCAALLAAHPTCLSVLELIGDPTDVIVS